MQRRHEFSNCIAAVGDFVFIFAGELCHCFVKIRYVKNWVIAEAILANFFFSNYSLNSSLGFKQDFLRACQGKAADESGCPFIWGDTIYQFEHFFNIAMIDEGSVGGVGSVA